MAPLAYEQQLQTITGLPARQEHVNLLKNVEHSEDAIHIFTGILGHLSCNHRRRLRGDMSPPLFEIRILSPPLLKMCKPIATEKIPTYSTEIVESKIMR